MNKAEVRSIIESNQVAGNKTPGLFDWPKMLGVKSKLETSSNIAEVIEMLEANRSIISKSLGLSDAVFADSLLRPKVLRYLKEYEVSF